MRARALPLIVCTILLFVGWKWMMLSNVEIAARSWKYNDRVEGVVGFPDFIHMDGGICLLRNDTLYIKERPLATVRSAYRGWGGRDRLHLKAIDPEQIVEYVAY